MNAETKNLDRIEKLEKLGYSGCDACLATSLFEYGMAWKRENNEVLFIYGIAYGTGAECDYNRFDRCVLPGDMDVFHEYSWADIDGVCETTGLTVEEFRTMPLENQIRDLVGYYGFENIFGSSYWEGFKIAED